MFHPSSVQEAAAAGPSRPAGADQMDTDGGAGTSKGEGADGDAGGEGEGGDAAAGGEEEASEEEDEFFEPDVDADGRHSPPPVRPAEVAGKDVVNEEDDFRCVRGIWVGGRVGNGRRLILGRRSAYTCSRKTVGGHQVW